MSSRARTTTSTYEVSITRIVVEYLYELDFAITGSTITLLTFTTCPTPHADDVRTNRKNLGIEIVRILVVRIVWILYASTLNKDSVGVRRTYYYKLMWSNTTIVYTNVTAWHNKSIALIISYLL